MQRIHVSEVYDSSLKKIFAEVSNHEQFLTGGGLTCRLLKEGDVDRNGNGAIRQIVSQSVTFKEEIFEYQDSMHFAYVILSLTPNKPLKHKKGWLDFTEIDGKTLVDWHSHFEITIPVVGGLIGWFVKRGIAKVFKKRLAYLKERLG